jgi:hypothetical protein
MIRAVYSEVHTNLTTFKGVAIMKTTTKTKPTALTLKPVKSPFTTVSAWFNKA